jgi:hypothetical protein
VHAVYSYPRNPGSVGQVVTRTVSAGAWSRGTSGEVTKTFMSLNKSRRVVHVIHE